MVRTEDACEFRDMVIDSCGVLFGITVVVIFNIIKNKLKKDNKKYI